jgi:hypothetical protein
MRYIVLFQNSCTACSRVAEMVRGLPVAGLEARPLEDPEVAGLLSHAGITIPDRPSLLVADGDNLEVLSGWAMRRRLAHAIGWRRSGAIARLLVAERRARLARSADGHALSRRGVIGGTLAAVAGWVVMPGSASASPRLSESKPIMAAADPAEVRAALATAAGQRAVRTWGAADKTAYMLSSGGRVTLMLTHPRDGIFTFIRMSPGAPLGAKPAAMSLGLTPGSEHSIRYYTTGGTPLCDLAAPNSRLQVSPVRDGRTVNAGPAAVAEPDVTPRQLACFIACTGRRAGAPCVGNCINCLAYILVHKNPAGLSCSECFVCAGRYGPDCVEECGI